MDDLWEGQFGLIYNSNGGVTYNEVRKMPKKKFLWFLERLTSQKKAEADSAKSNKNVEAEKPRSKWNKVLGLEKTR